MLLAGFSVEPALSWYFCKADKEEDIFLGEEAINHGLTIS
jgi:hypothetical protein